MTCNKPNRNPWLDAMFSVLLGGAMPLLLGCGGGGGAKPANPIPELGYTLTVQGQMKSPRYYHTATLLNDGRVLVVGGHNSILNNGPIPNPIGSTELFDPATGSSLSGPDLLQARGQHTAIKTPDGRVFLLGGGSYQVECFDPLTNTVRPAGSVPDRVGHSAILLPSGKIFMAGGQQPTCTLYNPATELSQDAGLLHAHDGRTPLDRHGLSTHLLPDGKVLIVGGFGSTPEWGYLSPLKLVEYYDPLTNTCTPTTRLNTARSFHAGITLSDGRIMILGGMGFDGTTRQSLASTEIYDPGTGGFSAGPFMITPRHDFKVAALPEGRFYISGGASYQDNLVTGRFTVTSNDCDEIFDPVTWTFSQVLIPLGNRWGQSLNPGKDGSLCITGGIIPGGVDSSILSFKLKPVR